MNRLEVVSVTLDEANEFVREHHRHHQPVPGAKFCVAAASEDEPRGRRGVPFDRSSGAVGERRAGGCDWLFVLRCAGASSGRGRLAVSADAGVEALRLRCPRAGRTCPAPTGVADSLQFAAQYLNRLLHLAVVPTQEIGRSVIN